MPDGGELAIEMTNQTVDDRYIATHAGAVRGDYVAIAVRDTGTGMASEVLKHAFEPFFTTKQEGQGTGLGLAMVYGFAKQSGGYTKIKSTPGKGTCVTLLLPRSTDAPRRPPRGAIWRNRSAAARASFWSRTTRWCATSWRWRWAGSAIASRRWPMPARR